MRNIKEKHLERLGQLLAATTRAWYGKNAKSDLTADHMVAYIQIAAAMLGGVKLKRVKKRRRIRGMSLLEEMAAGDVILEAPEEDVKLVEERQHGSASSKS